MDGPELFRRAVVRMGEASARVIEEAGLTLDQIDLLIPHQANVRIIDATARRLGLDSAKVFVNIGSYGNTSAATIPVALTEALEQGRIKPGDHVVFTAFGAGLSWGAAVVRWGDRVEPIATSDAELATEHPFDDGAPRAEPRVLRPPNQDRDRMSEAQPEPTELARETSS